MTMFRRVLAAPFCAALLASAVPLAAQTAPRLPDWMAGTWAMEDGSAWSEEIWTSPRGDLMMGMAKTGFGPNLESWEVTRIVRKQDGSISFLAQPKGAPPAEFPMAVASDQAIEFANPAHKYPQRIRYWREGQLLMAEISRIDGSDAVRWNYRPVETAGAGER